MAILKRPYLKRRSRMIVSLVLVNTSKSVNYRANIRYESSYLVKIITIYIIIEIG